MNEQQLEQLMHRVLDGEATPAERDELMKAVDAGPEVAEQWRTMQVADQAFRGAGNAIDELLPPVQVPDGMTDLVMQKWNLEQPAPSKKTRKTSKIHHDAPSTAVKPGFRFDRPFIQIGIAAAAIAFWVFVGGLLNPEEEIKSPETFVVQSGMTMDTKQEQTSGVSASTSQSDAAGHSPYENGESDDSSRSETETSVEHTSAVQSEDPTGDVTSGNTRLQSETEKAVSEPDAISNQVSLKPDQTNSKKRTVQPEESTVKPENQVSAKRTPNGGNTAGQTERVNGADMTITGDAGFANQTTESTDAGLEVDSAIMPMATDQSDSANESAGTDLMGSTQESFKSAASLAKPSAVAMAVPDAATPPIYRFDQNKRKAILESGYLSVYDQDGKTLIREVVTADAISQVVEWKWSGGDRKLTVIYLVNLKSVTFTVAIP